ncbi:MAG TPA: hypothetical protein ENI70_00090, partial [Candidatus Peregrinibacteria bacterium]|nr:hypothetical protein [Candidatus Peregrinibacteria bacterium]
MKTVNKLNWFFQRESLLLLSKASLFLFVFALPFSVRTLIYDQVAYQNGLFSDFLASFLYLPEIFLALALFFFALGFFQGAKTKLKWGPKKLGKTVLLVFLASLLPYFWAEDPSLVFFSGLKLLEFLLLYFLLQNLSLKLKNLLLVMVSSLVLQAALGGLQFLFQSSLGLHFLGEAHLSPEIPGVAKFIWQGEKYIRAYGTTPHANVLAGLLAIGFFLTVLLVDLLRKSKKLLNKKKKRIFWG